MFLRKITGKHVRESIKQISTHCTKMKFLIKDFFRKCKQIHRKLQIWSHILKKSLMKTLYLRCDKFITGLAKLLKRNTVAYNSLQFSQ